MTIDRISELDKPYLQLLYKKLNDTMLVENRLREDSLILSILQLKSNDRHDVLEKASISNERIPMPVLVDMKRRNLIRESDEVNKYIITAKGIWIIEKDKGKISAESIINFLDEKFFDVSLKGKGLTDKEKVILLAMLAARTFSEQSPIDLKKDEFVLDAWERIINKSNNLLYELKVIKKMNKNQLYGKKGNEHIVSNLIRHTDSLRKKIKRLYNAPGNQKYYLSLYDNNDLSTESLEYIIRKIFDDKEFSYDFIEKIINFSQKIAYDEAANVHDFEKHIFASPIFDDKIKHTIEEALFS